MLELTNKDFNVVIITMLNEKNKKLSLNKNLSREIITKQKRKF